MTKTQSGGRWMAMVRFSVMWTHKWVMWLQTESMEYFVSTWSQLVIFKQIFKIWCLMKWILRQHDLWRTIISQHTNQTLLGYISNHFYARMSTLVTWFFFQTRLCTFSLQQIQSPGPGWRYVLQNTPETINQLGKSLPCASQKILKVPKFPKETITHKMQLQSLDKKLNTFYDKSHLPWWRNIIRDFKIQKFEIEAVG